MSGPKPATLSFDQSASKHIIESFGWEVGDENLIVNEDGEWIPSYLGEKAYLGEFAGIVKTPEGRPAVLRENFNELAEYVGDSRDE